MDTVIYLANKVMEIIDENELENEAEVLDWLDTLNELSIRF